MEYPSRTGLISLLIAVEVVIAGFALYTLRNTGDAFASAGGFHHVEYSAAPFAPVAAGPSPVVSIDDIDSKVVVSTSTDGMVHVTDLTQVSGWILGTDKAQKLEVSRTPDGVRIYRPQGHFTLGMTNNRIEVSVPANAQVTITRSGGDEIRGLQQGVDVTSQDGRITLTDITGNVKAHSDDGRIIATNVHGNQLELTTNDGRLELADIQLTGGKPQATFHTNDGSLHISGVFPADGTYSLTTGDGRVELALQDGSDVSVDASTGDGRVELNGRRYDGQAIRVGAGSGSMRVRSEDGSIHLTSNGAQ